MKRGLQARRIGGLAVLLMVIGVAACDNVDWGGIDVAVVPPPPRSGPVTGGVDAGDELPRGPVLYHVTRDSAGVTMVPVAEVEGAELRPIATGDDPAAFGERFITAFLRSEAEFTLFRNGQRAGTLVVESAEVPAAGTVCRPLPRATGSVELSGGAAGEATEFLAMARTQAPQGRMVPGGEIQVEGRMQVIGNIMAERALRARGAQLPNWSRARRQLQPFPVAEARDFGFTATFLVDDELAVGNDDQGYSLFIVYTPQAQTGYDTAYVDYTSYTAEGKAAPRVIDFLDWDRDGSVELLLEVFGTTNKWYAAVGQDDDEWRRVFEDRCDPGAAMAASPDTAAADTAGGAAGATGAAQPGTGTTGQTPPQQQSPPAQQPPAQPQGQQQTTPPPTESESTAPLQAAVDPMDLIQPRIGIRIPTLQGVGDSRPDTSGGRTG